MKCFALYLGAMTIGTAGEAGAQSPAIPCSVTAIDSAIYGAIPTYRDCDVDQPARLIASPRPAVSFQPDPLCVYAELEFAVDEEGRPITASARAKKGNSRGFTRLTLSTLSDWRYMPATKGGVPVRQVVKARIARENDKLLTVTLMRPGDRVPPPGPQPPCK